MVCHTASNYYWLEDHSLVLNCISDFSVVHAEPPKRMVMAHYCANCNNILYGGSVYLMKSFIYYLHISKEMV
jgi:hypothetical protein